MYDRHAQFKAGVVVLLALAALLIFLFYAGGAEPIWRDYAYVHLRFEPGFLAPVAGDAVKMNGMKIGTVHEVMQKEEIRSGEDLTEADRLKLRLEPGEDGEARELYVLAVIKIPADQELPKGTRAEIKRSLTGTRDLDLMPGSSPENIVPEETVENPIPAFEQPDIGEIAKQVSRLVLRVESVVSGGEVVMDDLSALLRRLRERVDALVSDQRIEDIHATVKTLRETAEKVAGRAERIVDNFDEASVDVKRMAGTGAAAMEEVREGLNELLETLREVGKKMDRILARAEPRVDEFLTNLARAGRSLSKLSGEFSGIGPEAERILADIGVDIKGIMRNVGDATRNLADASEDLRAHPWKLLNKPEPGEIAFENLRNASLNYMRAMRDMNRTANHLVSALNRKDLTSPEARALLRNAVGEFQTSLSRYRRDEQRWQQLFQQQPPR